MALMIGFGQCILGARYTGHPAVRILQTTDIHSNLCDYDYYLVISPIFRSVCVTPA